MTLLSELLWNDENKKKEREEEGVNAMSFACLEMCCSVLRPKDDPPTCFNGASGCK